MGQKIVQWFKGLPWLPVPGRESLEPPIKVGVPEEDSALLKPVEAQKRELVKRDFRINRSMVKDYGLTEGCRGCLNADSGNPIALNHSARCRQRLFDIIGDKHPEQLEKITEKWRRKTRDCYCYASYKRRRHARR